MMEHVTILTRIGDAVALEYAADREGAHMRLTALWERDPSGWRSAPPL
jgi:hypothetical protein